MKTIHIPNSLVDILSFDLKLRRLVVFYYHFETYNIFPTKRIKPATFKILSKEIGVSIRTIQTHFKYLVDRGLIIKKDDMFWLKHPIDLYNEISMGCLKAPFTQIFYRPMSFEIQIQALPIYLNALKQEFIISQRISYQYHVEIGSPEFNGIKKILFSALVNNPYSSKNPKVAPIITLEYAAQLISKSSDSTAFHLFKKLKTFKLLTIHKIPKPFGIKVKPVDKKFNFIREPPNVIIFKKW